MIPILAATLVSSLVAFADLELPQASPAATVTQRVGITDLEIDYHRPVLGGRAFQPNGEVWRFGANDATTITFGDDVTIDGKAVKAGTYALFAIPRADRWTLILNSQAKQWGAYFHDAAKDVLRFDVKPDSGPSVESLTFAITPEGDSTAQVEFAWSTVRVRFDIAIDTAGLVEAGIESALDAADAKDWQTPLQVAKYRMATRTRLDQGFECATRAYAASENFWTCEWKARYLRERGETDAALPLLDKAIELSGPGGAPKEYTAGLATLKQEWTAPKKP